MTDFAPLIASLDSSELKTYTTRSIPKPFDDVVRRFTTEFSQTDATQRPGILAVMNDRHAFALRRFAERMASYAVRTLDRRNIEEGMWALAIASQKTYYKEIFPIISLLVNSCEKLGVDSAQLFQVIPTADPEFRTYVDGFLQRSKEGRAIAKMAYKESQDEDGFVYKRDF